MKKIKETTKVLVAFLGYVPSVLAQFEEISMYRSNRTSPEKSSVATVLLDDVHDGPSDENIFANNPYHLVVRKNKFCFDQDTYYVDERDERSFFQVSEDIKTSISAFGITKLTLESFKKNAKGSIFRKLDTICLNLYPHDEVCGIGIRNAYYQRTHGPGQGGIHFCKKEIETAHFFDVVAHATGHAILDALQPHFLMSNSVHVAFHESFGDLSSFFASLHFLTQDHFSSLPDSMRSQSFYLAEGGSGVSSCLRGSMTCNEFFIRAHDQSNFFTRFFISSMQEVFKFSEQTSLAALSISDFFQDLLMQCIESYKKFENLYDFSRHMIHTVDGFHFLNKQSKPLIKDIISHYSFANLFHLSRYTT